MGTNYYLRVKHVKMDISAPLFIKNRINEKLNESMIEAMNIHIGKKSIGWKFLFKRNNDLYTTYDELGMFYLNNIDDLMIVDEYEEELTWGEFSKVVKGNGEQRKSGDYDHVFNCWSHDEFC